MKLFEFDANIGEWRTLIQTRDIQNGAVRSQHIAGSAVTGDKIAGGEIKSRHIADDAVTGDKIADSSIPGSKLTEGCITGDKIVGGTVKQGKLADNAVAERNIQSHSVTGEKIADGAIRPVHVPQETILHITKDVQNQIDGIQVAGVAVSNEFGNNPHIALSQKKVTETILGQQEAIDELENSVGEGGSVDTRIDQAKSDIIGDAGAGYDTLKKVQDRIVEEKEARQMAQSTIYTKNETYSKAEVDNIATAFTSQKYVTAEATDSTTTDNLKALIDAAAGASGKEKTDTIYRVANWDGTQYDTSTYSEYTWNGTSYLFLRSKNEGIDDEPTEDSANPVKSGGVLSFVEKNVKNISGGIKLAICDGDNNIIAYLHGNDLMRFLCNLSANQVSASEIKTSKIVGKTINPNTGSQFQFVMTDDNENITFAVMKNGDILTSNGFLAEGKNHTSNVYQRNLDKVDILSADSAIGISDKRLQLMVVTDTHHNLQNFANAVDMVNETLSTTALIHLGDMTDLVSPDGDLYKSHQETIDKAKKPIYIAIGNHDTGTYSSYIKYCKDQDTLYNRYVKPSVDKGHLSEEEYEEGKCYYYHDFAEEKVRLIVLYPYDSGDVFDESKWKVVDYSSSYPELAAGDYSEGDKVKVSGWTKCAFEAVGDVHVSYANPPLGKSWEMINGEKVDYHAENNPRFKTVPYYSWFSQDQLDWFVDALEGAQTNDYTVVIACHYPLMYSAGTSPAEAYPDTEKRFHNPLRGTSMEFEVRYATADKNLIAQILNVYVNGGTISKTVYPYGETDASNRYSDREGYGLDDARSLSPVYLNYTFAGGGKALILAGHNHTDAVVKSDSYNLTQISFLCGKNPTTSSQDITRDCLGGKEDDTMTGVTVYSNKVHLTRVGIDTTIRIGNDNALISKKNEVLTF